MQTPPSRAVGALDAALLLGAVVVGTQLAIAACIRFVAATSPVSMAVAGETIASRPIVAGLAQAFVSGAVLLLARRFYLPGRRFGDAYGLRAVSFGTVVAAAATGATMQIPLAEIANLVEEVVPIPLEEKLRLAALVSPTSFLSGLGLVLAVVAIAPVAEELVFRGLLLPGIARGSGLGIGVFVSTLGFAIAHVRPASVVVAFVGGLVLAFTTVRTRSIVPSIVLHAANNAVPILLPHRLVPFVGMNVVSDGPSHVDPRIVAASLVAFGLAIAVLVRESTSGEAG